MRSERFKTESAEYAVHVNEAEPGKPYALFLHGAGFHGAGERQVLGTRLNPNRGFIWFDLLGAAGSPAHSPEKITWASQVRDIALIIQRFAKGPVDVIGHCLASHITHDLVREHRPLVRSAVWYSAAHAIADIFKGVIARSLLEGRLTAESLTAEERDALVRFQATPAEEFGAREAHFVLVLSTKIRGFNELYWTDAAAMQENAKLMTEYPFSVEAFLRLQSEFFDQKRGSLPVPSYEGIPVLMLHSDDDRITPWELNGKQLLKRIPHAKSALIRGGSHWLQFQKPDECARETLAFLKALDGK